VGCTWESAFYTQNQIGIGFAQANYNRFFVAGFQNSEDSQTVLSTVYDEGSSTVVLDEENIAISTYN
jgi:hypothetical protein